MKKEFQESTPKVQMLMSGLPRNHILGYGISFPLEPQLVFYIYFVKYGNILKLKRIRWDSGGCVCGGGGGEMMFLKYFSISYIVNTNAKSDHFSHKLKLDIHGNRKSNANQNRYQQQAYI